MSGNEKLGTQQTFTSSDQPKQDVPPVRTLPFCLRNPKKLLIIIAGVLVILTVSPLVKQLISPSPDEESKFLPTPSSPVGPKTTVAPTATDRIQSPLGQAQDKFGFKIFHQLLSDSQQENLFISPSSIALALYMTYNGAGGETKAAMAKTLAVENLSLDELNQQSKELLNLLANPDEKVEVSVANSIWGREGIQFGKEFLETNQRYYNAEVAALDFGSSGAVDTINAWVNDNTRGKIPTIIQPPIPPDVMMYLINAIYFKGAWTVEFDPKLTEEKDFTLSSGNKIKHSLMKQKGDFRYLATDDFQAISLPYGTNERLSMYVFLPKKDPDLFTQQLQLDAWKTWLDQFEIKKGTILLPKFKIEYETSLNNALKNLGMGIAFSSQANFEKIHPETYISQVKHKSFVEVNEEGTEAAAVTSITIVGSAVTEKKLFSMEVNRPFFFAIRDNQTGTTLFMGLIMDPSS
jgi:serine protease inhibitor